MPEGGEAQTEVVTCLLNPIFQPNIDVFEDPDPTDCCYELPVFADLSDANELKNDTWTFYRGYELSTTDVDIILTKPSDSSFVDVTLTNNTYGTYYNFGFYVDSLGRKYARYDLDWRLVLTLHGEGTYQLKTDETKIVGANQEYLDFEFCLGNYSPARADETIRMEYTNENILGDRENVKDTVHFPDGFTNMFRVFGVFGGDNSEYETEATKFNDQSLRDISSRQIEKYSHEIHRAPSRVHEYVKTNILQADTIEITDYNRNAAIRHIKTPVRNPSEYKPNYDQVSLLASVTFEWETRYDTKRKKYC